MTIAAMQLSARRSTTARATLRDPQNKAFVGQLTATIKDAAGKVIATAAQPPHFMASGRYVDHFQKRGGEWRILRRFTVVDGQYDLLPSEQSKNRPPAYAPGERPVALDRSDLSYQRPVRTRAPKQV